MQPRSPRALRFFYLSLGVFAAAALISILVSVLSISALQIGFPAIALLAPLSGTVGWPVSLSGAR
jgi:hypothetical protein